MDFLVLVVVPCPAGDDIRVSHLGKCEAIINKHHKCVILIFLVILLIVEIKSRASPLFAGNL